MLRLVHTRPAQGAGSVSAEAHSQPPPARLGRPADPLQLRGAGAESCGLVLTPWPPCVLTTGGWPRLLAPHPSQGLLTPDGPRGTLIPSSSAQSASLASGQEDPTEPKGA